MVFQAALVGQRWNGAGSTGGLSLGGNSFTLGTNGDLELFGLRLMAGIIY